MCQGALTTLYPQLYARIRHLTFIQGIPGPLTLQGVCSMLLVDAVPEPLYSWPVLKTLLTLYSLLTTALLKVQKSECHGK